MPDKKLSAQLGQAHLVGRAIESCSLNKFCLAEEKATGLWTTESLATAKDDSICLRWQRRQRRKREDMMRALNGVGNRFLDASLFLPKPIRVHL
jgi:hypothetical protein